MNDSRSSVRVRRVPRCRRTYARGGFATDLSAAATLFVCSIWSCRWSAVAVAPRPRGGGACARELIVRADEPHLITPRLDPGCPGVLAGPLRRRAARSDRRGQGARSRRPRRPAGRCAAAGLARLLSLGCRRRAADRRACADPPLAGPPPRRRPGHPDRPGRDGRAPRCRGGAGAADARHGPRLRRAVQPRPAAQHRRAGAAHQARVAGAVLLVDDIVTTGATAAESVRVLQAIGAHVLAVLALAHA